MSDRFDRWTQDFDRDRERLSAAWDDLANVVRTELIEPWAAPTVSWLSRRLGRENRH